LIGLLETTAPWGLATDDIVRRPHAEFRCRIKTQTVLPSAETAAMLFWSLLVSARSPCAMSTVGGASANLFPQCLLIASPDITLVPISEMLSGKISMQSAIRPDAATVTTAADMWPAYTGLSPVAPAAHCPAVPAPRREHDRRPSDDPGWRPAVRHRFTLLVAHDTRPRS